MRAMSPVLTSLLLIGGAAFAACGGEDPADVEERPKDNFLFVELPEDAQQLSWGCSPADTFNPALCQKTYATGQPLDEMLDFYRAKFEGGDWRRLIDNRNYQRYVWTLSWRNETYSMTMNFQDPERRPEQLDESVQTVV
jgi:hypothetical protein